MVRKVVDDNFEDFVIGDIFESWFKVVNVLDVVIGGLLVIGNIFIFFI